MQLAAAPRPHPPPVPPRPSRQVVAEALKRSPRPPCPTRQAPPPPDTKPWRAHQQKQKQEQENEVKSGRTIVYESSSKITNVEQKNEDKCVVDGAGVSRISDSTVNPELHQGRVLSERNERNLTQNANIIRQRPTPVERQQPLQLVARNNLMAHQQPKIINVEKEQTADTKIRNQRHIQIVNGAIVFEARNPVIVKSKDENAVQDDRIYENNNSVDVDNSKVNDRTEESSAKELKEMEPEDKANKGNLISNDDCATVVVIDEPEKRVVFEDSINIQHQDWLEAGVRYSSTKITLSGDEVTDEAHDSAEDHEVNGFDYYDEEQLISAFDFARYYSHIVGSFTFILSFV